MVWGEGRKKQEPSETTPEFEKFYGKLCGLMGKMKTLLSIWAHSHNCEVTAVIIRNDWSAIISFSSGFGRSRITLLWKPHSVYFSFRYLNWVLCGLNSRALRNVSVLFPSWLSESSEPEREECHMSSQNLCCWVGAVVKTYRMSSEWHRGLKKLEFATSSNMILLIT